MKQCAETRFSKQQEIYNDFHTAAFEDSAATNNEPLLNDACRFISKLSGIAIDTYN